MTAFPRSIATALSLAVLTACGGVAPTANSIPQPAFEHPHATLTVFPHRLILSGIGKKYAKTFVVKEAGYTGSFNTTELYGCMQAATLTPSFGTGPRAKLTLTGVKKTTTTCKITFMDTNSHTATFKFKVL